MSNYSLVFDSEEKFHDVLAALAAYGRKETNAGDAADAMGLDSYSGNARRTVKLVISDLAEQAGLTNPFEQEIEEEEEPESDSVSFIL